MAKKDNADAKKLRDLTVSELRATRNDMLRRNNFMAARAAGTATFRSYVRQVNAIQNAVRDLEKTELLTFLQELKGQQGELRQGIENLKDARKRIKRVAALVEATATVLKVVARLAKMAAT